jgi:hypothetical protein
MLMVDRQGQTLGTIGERANYQGRALSHGETRVAAVIGEPSNLFIINLLNGVRTPFTFDSARYEFPIWSPDDQFIDFGAPSKNRNQWIVSRRVAPAQSSKSFPTRKSRWCHSTDPGMACWSTWCPASPQATWCPALLAK